MADSISDFLTIIRNAYSARKPTCAVKYSNIHLGIASILKEEGYINDVAESSDDKGHKNLVLTLKYINEDNPAIVGIKRYSRPGRRMYFKGSDVPRVLGGLGLGIVTTSQGLLRDRDARRQNVGGELICQVW